MTDRKVILITGAGRGIGRALTETAAADGYAVAINYRSDRAEAESFAAALRTSGADAIAVQADVAVTGAGESLVDAVMRHFGRLDGVVNNAGIGEPVDLGGLTEAHFERTLRVNLTGAFLVSQAAWPHMTKAGGRLIFMSSGAARSGGKVSAAYAASKAGLEGLMHYYATYLRPHRITANAIAPALIESDMARRMDLPSPDELPLGRLGRASEMWPALRMILETEYLTGQTVHIDAGRYMT